MAKVSNKTVGTAVAFTAAAAAAAAGAYWLYGAKDAAKNRKMAKGWMLKARAEVVEAVEKLSDIDKETYLRIVDEVTKRYAGVAGVTSAEIARAARDLKGSWDHIRQAQKVSGATNKAKKKTAKKSAKKAKSKK